MSFAELAQLLLDSDWTQESLERLLDSVYRSNKLMMNRRQSKITSQLLAAGISLAFPMPPSRTRLVEHLRLAPGARRGLRVFAIRRARFEGALAGSQMRRTSVGQLKWAYPPIDNLRELATCLGTLDRTLDWLSRGPRGLGACSNHYRVQVVAKRSGGVRLIEAPKTRLKRMQREILDQILNRLPVHPSAHGFVRQRSVLTHVQPHLGQPWILRMDLEDFFPSIDGARIFGLFRSLGYPYEVVQALTNLTTNVLGMDTIHESIKNWVPRETEPRVIADLGRLYFRRHLPQGAPTSPTLANLIAFRFDCRLAGLAKAWGVNYSRYADDLLFSGTSITKPSISKMSDRVSAIALEEGFRVQHRKTTIVPRTQRQIAVGIVLNEKTNMVRQEFERLKAILHNCRRFGPASQNRTGHANFAAHLLGRIHWLCSLNAARGRKLLEVYKQIEWSVSSKTGAD